MDDREKMLAEGPRVAPEPPTADGFAPPPPTPDGFAPPPPDVPQTPPDPARNSGWSPPRNLVRYLPLLFFVAIFVRAALGKNGAWVVVPIFVAAVLARRLRRRGK